MPHIPTLQMLWLVVYWGGLLPVVYFLVIALTNGANLQSLAALFISVFAITLGAAWATRVARRHVNSDVFVKGTTTIRVISLAWLAIGIYITIAPVISVLGGIDVGDPGTALGYVSTVGSISLLAVLGPGYAEYREAKSHAADPA